MNAPVRIIGVGSPFGDDRAGWEAAAMLDAVLPREFADAGRVAVEMLDRPGARLIERLGGAEAVIILDAVKSGGVPGSVYRYAARQLISAPAGVSSHGFGVAEALSLASALGIDLRRVTVYGIEVDPAQCGESISTTARNALPQVAARIAGELAALGCGAARLADRATT
jgi:hydrogenase maturation protease